MRNGAGNWDLMPRRASTSTWWKPGLSIPLKVVRVALENAVSVASVLLLTEATMTEIPEDTKPAGARA